MQPSVLGSLGGRRARRRPADLAAFVCLLLLAAIVLPAGPAAAVVPVNADADPAAPCDDDGLERCAGLWSAACCDYLVSRATPAIDVTGAPAASPAAVTLVAYSTPARPHIGVPDPRGHDPTEPTAPFLLGHSVLLC